MITFRFSGRTPMPRAASIGQETDQDAEKLRFLLPQVADGQTATLQMLLPDGTADAIAIRDGIVLVPAAMTEQPGRIRAWVEILGGGIAWNSEMLYLDVGDLPPISEMAERQYPTLFQEAMDALGRALQYWESTEALDAETGKFRGLTAGGHTVPYDAGADAVLSERDGHYHLEISAERGAPGENGRDAAVITLGPAQYAFHLENGHLILEYGDDGIPSFSIDEQGHLIMEYDGDIPAPQPGGGGMGAAIFGTAVFG